MNTYWVVGKENYSRTLPDYESQFKEDEPQPKRLPTTTGKVPKISMESGFSEINIFDGNSSRKSSTNEQRKQSGEYGLFDSRKNSAASQPEGSDSFTRIEVIPEGPGMPRVDTGYEAW